MKRLAFLVGLLIFAPQGAAATEGLPSVAQIKCEETLETFRLLAEQLSASRQQGEIGFAEIRRRLEAKIAAYEAMFKAQGGGPVIVPQPADKAK